MSDLFIPVLHGATGRRPDEIDTLRTAEAVRDALRRLGHRSRLIALGTSGARLDFLASRYPDLVFNLVEAVDGLAAPAAAIPEALTRRGLRYTGCGPVASRRCLSKIAQKERMTHAGLPTPRWCRTGRHLADCRQVIVKSTTEHASIGIDQTSVVPGIRAAETIAARLARHGDAHFAEAYVEGREFALSLLEAGGEVRVLPPAETLFVGYGADRFRIVDYDAKWVDGSHAFENTPRRFDFPPEDGGLLAELDRLARACWALFDLAGYARVDFRVDDAGQPWILEVNTNPCLAPDAGFVAAAARMGLGFDDLICQIVAEALSQPSKAA